MSTRRSLRGWLVVEDRVETSLKRRLRRLAARRSNLVPFLHDGRNELAQSTQLQDRLFHRTSKGIEAIDVGRVDGADGSQSRAKLLRGRRFALGVFYGAD